MTLSSRLDALEKLAKAATPGLLDARRINATDRPYALISPSGKFGDEIIAGYLLGDDARFYAAANPSAILELVKEVRGLLKEKTDGAV